MMNEIEYLLTVLGEELNETGQRCSKAIRFGHEEVQDGQSLTNSERIVIEYIDILAVVEMLKTRGLMKMPRNFFDLLAAKIKKVEGTMEYSRQCGTLEKW